MKAKTLYQEILSKIKGGFTARVAINRARKHGLSDNYENILFYTSMTLSEGREFEGKGKAHA